MFEFPYVVRGSGVIVVDRRTASDRTATISWPVNDGDCLVIGPDRLMYCNHDPMCPFDARRDRVRFDDDELVA